MKEFYAWIVLCFIILLILFKLDSVTNHRKLVEQYEFDKLNYEKKIEELEQEIRVLKTDVYVFQYGYETEVAE